MIHDYSAQSLQLYLVSSSSVKALLQSANMPYPSVFWHLNSTGILEALIATFWQSLANWVKDELVASELPESSDALVSLCNRIDIRYRQRSLERAHERRVYPHVAPHFQPLPLPAPTTKPMQLGHSCLSSQELDRCSQNNLCMYCTDFGHFRASCPVRETQTFRISLTALYWLRLHRSATLYAIDSVSCQSVPCSYTLCGFWRFWQFHLLKL